MSGEGGPNQNEEDEEEYDALFIKRLLDLYREKNIPLSILYGQQRRMKNPPPPKTGQELLLSEDVDNAQY